MHVHDILWQRGDDDWKMHISDYRKLRLDSETINRRLEAGGLRITARSMLDGMLVTVAEAPG